MIHMSMFFGSKVGRSGFLLDVWSPERAAERLWMAWSAMLLSVVDGAGKTNCVPLDVGGVENSVGDETGDVLGDQRRVLAAAA